MLRWESVFHLDFLTLGICHYSGVQNQLGPSARVSLVPMYFSSLTTTIAATTTTTTIITTTLYMNEC